MNHLLKLLLELSSSWNVLVTLLFGVAILFSVASGGYAEVTRSAQGDVTLKLGRRDDPPKLPPAD